MNLKISTLLIMFFLVSSVFAQSPFTAEEVAEMEEEFAEEVVIIEEKAGTTPDEILYVVDEVVEDITLLLKDGEDKAEFALAVKEEKLAEAALMVGAEDSDATATALTKAGEVSDIVADEIGLNLEDSARASVEISQELLASLQGKLPTEAEWQEVESLITDQMSQEEKIKLAADIVDKLSDYCDELAKLDWHLMEQDDRCDPAQAPEWLQGYIEEDLQERQAEAEEMMVEMVTTCINDPRDCDCSEIIVKSEQQECEKSTQLAIQCEFEQDMSACEQLGDPSLEGVPEFMADALEGTMQGLIAEKEKEMFAKFAPNECIEAGATTREECEEIMIDLYLPDECKEAGATTKEACTALMEGLYGAPPEECMGDDGEPMDMEECEAIMMKQFDIPQACMEDGSPVSAEECEAIMMKQMGSMPGEGMGTPSECVVDGEFIGDEACGQIMMEAGGPPEEMPGPSGGMPGAEGVPGGMPGAPPGGMPMAPPEGIEGIQEFEENMEYYQGVLEMPDAEGMVLITNPDTGEMEPVTPEQAQEWAEQYIGSDFEEEDIGYTPETEQMQNMIEEMEMRREQEIPPPGFEEREDEGDFEQEDFGDGGDYEAEFEDEATDEEEFEEVEEEEPVDEPEEEPSNEEG